MSDPPNVVLVVADDVPRNMLSTYGAQNSLSPHIESLAREGVAFDRAYTAAPLCTPSRFGLLTGRFASNASSITVHRPWNLVGFNTFLNGVETIAHALRRHGYLTAFSGKYHLGFPLPAKGRKGSATFGGHGWGLDYEQLSEAVRTYGGFARTLAVWGGNRQTEKSPHNPEWMAAGAAEFIGEAALRRQPFFLYFAGTVPHQPFAVPTAFRVNVSRTPAGDVPFARSWKEARDGVLGQLRALGLVCRDHRECLRMAYDGADGRHNPAYERPIAITEPWLQASWLYAAEHFEQARLARLFLAGLAWLDSSVGGVLAALEAHGLKETTLVAYCADHGPSYLGKGHVYEAGVRVPLVMRWPKGFGGQGGVRVPHPVTLLDVAPTILAAAGVPGTALPTHGESLLPLLRPASAVPAVFAAERPIFIEVGFARAVVRGSWKLVVVNDLADRCRTNTSTSAHVPQSARRGDRQVPVQLHRQQPSGVAPQGQGRQRRQPVRHDLRRRRAPRRLLRPPPAVPPRDRPLGAAQRRRAAARAVRRAAPAHPAPRAPRRGGQPRAAHQVGSWHSSGAYG